jgi:hypothetical protein
LVTENQPKVLKIEFGYRHRCDADSDHGHYGGVVPANFQGDDGEAVGAEQVTKTVRQKNSSQLPLLLSRYKKI